MQISGVGHQVSLRDHPTGEHQTSQGVLCFLFSIHETDGSLTGRPKSWYTMKSAESWHGQCHAQVPELFLPPVSLVRSSIRNQKGIWHVVSQQHVAGGCDRGFINSHEFHGVLIHKSTKFHKGNKSHLCLVCARAAYWGFRYDGKARAEANRFERFYSCMYICDACLSQRKTKKSDPNLWYFDFRDSSPRHMTRIDDTTYRQTAKEISPYHLIQGWKLETCLRDIMHVVYLGTARDLIPSLLGDWLESPHNVLGDPAESLDIRLRRFSMEMHATFRTNK